MQNPVAATAEATPAEWLEIAKVLFPDGIASTQGGITGFLLGLLILRGHLICTALGTYLNARKEISEKYKLKHVKFEASNKSNSSSDTNK